MEPAAKLPEAACVTVIVVVPPPKRVTTLPATVATFVSELTNEYLPILFDDGERKKEESLKFFVMFARVIVGVRLELCTVCAEPPPLLCFDSTNCIQDVAFLHCKSIVGNTHIDILCAEEEELDAAWCTISTFDCKTTVCFCATEEASAVKTRFPNTRENRTTGNAYLNQEYMEKIVDYYH